jgi:hypothetical protein
MGRPARQQRGAVRVVHMGDGTRGPNDDRSHFLEQGMNDLPVKRKPGRPRRYAFGRHKVYVRLTPARHADLISEAKKNRRGLSEELEMRIERSFIDDVLEQLKQNVDRLVQAQPVQWWPGFPSLPIAETRPLTTEEHIEKILQEALERDVNDN